MHSVPTSWNKSAIKTRSDNPGMEMRRDGKVMRNGDSQKLEVVNRSKTIPLRFTPVKTASIGYEKMTAGDVNAFATLILTQYWYHKRRFLIECFLCCMLTFCLRIEPGKGKKQYDDFILIVISRKK